MGNIALVKENIAILKRPGKLGIGLLQRMSIS